MQGHFTYLKERIEDISAREDTSIRKVLKQIDKGALGIALLVEPDTGIFKGILTDGDVRRALILGLELDSAVSNIVRPKSITASIDTSSEQLSKLFGEAVRIIPLLDKHNKVVDLALFDTRIYLPVSEPNLGEKELKYVSDCILTGWVSSAGKYVTRFEQMFAKFCGTKFGISSSSGTTALHLSLLALGIGAGDEVIVPSFTFISTANAVAFTGANPVFVDSEMETWNIDPQKIEQAITSRTKAIIPVHIYGHPAQMSSILEIAGKYNLAVVEDAAEAHGALYKGNKTGSLGDMGIFSFYGNKIITTGEGGMVVTDNKELADKIRIFRDHGMDTEKRYRHSVLGYNYRMTNIQAALGVGQMERIDQIIEQKCTNAFLYSKELKNIPGITLPPNEKWAKNIYWLYSILIDEKKFGMSSVELGKRLKIKSIETRPLFPPVHQQPIYDTKQNLPVCEKLSNSGLSLPSSTNIKKDEINRIAWEIKKIKNQTTNEMF
ncbi:aminotransferase class I/II-fold pyridoxal phosphate-dependent enzyme [Desulfobacula toluolica]|uniref:GDP-perosamine synthase n=1 Tax=Desulfobacula toluolica (strain DSM 7467 / Tol2) TaxID=651182 RepID=K0NNR7_DESTT|nr:aminotransferase class I/II-fold pyridoxal phosphate-dependent enzyme [Desulfobacula toluolica]CCK81693.1 cystathione beta-synthase modulated DegT/DnrJ/EryC1/StrS aminotransferase [Desulfobacula toluolica Tol2]